MPGQWSGTPLREFQTLFREGSASGLTDRQLLERFTERRDETAFAGLIDRHRAMVWGVCRRMLHDPADAGDAFQATFLVLVRRAGSVRVDESLGPWLYGVSIRVAKRARVVAIRRREREQTNTELPEPPARDANPPDDLRSVIDEELQQLPARYRSALVCCYLEGLTHEEAARRLSCPIGTVRSRLARGRDLLRARLERRGLAPEAIAFAPTLSRVSGQPEALCLSTAQAAARLAAGQSLAGTVPASVELLVAGVARTMVLSKLGLMASCLALSLIGIAAFAGQRVGIPRGAAPAAEASNHPVEPPHAPVAVALATSAAGQQPTDPEAEDAFQGLPAVIVKTVPPTGATNVDPSLKTIQVTFNKEMMDESWSWVQQSKNSYPKSTGSPHYEKDKRTCVLPVTLEPGKTYAVWLNSPRFGNFKDAEGRSAVPYLLLFHTKAP